MAVFIVLGIPGAGKTTFCRQIVESENVIVLRKNVKHISFDNFRASCETDSATGRTTRKLFEKYLEEQFSTAKTYEFLIFLIEDVFHLRSMRRAIRRRAIAAHLYFRTVFIDVDLETAFNRNRQRTENWTDEKTIKKLFDDFERPTEDEDFVTFNGETNVSLEWLLTSTKIDSSQRLSPYVKPEKTGSVRSTDDQLDAETRGIVSEIIAKGAVKDVAALCKARIKVFRDIKAMSLDDFCKEDLKNRIYSLYLQFLAEKEAQ